MYRHLNQSNLTKSPSKDGQVYFPLKWSINMSAYVGEKIASTT